MAVEAVMLIPAGVLLIMLIVFGARVTLAHQAVEAAAAEAARAASIARTSSTASNAGNTAADASLAAQSLKCMTKNIVVDTSGFASPVGTPAKVTTTVTCKVRVSDLGLPGAPGSLQVTSTMTSPIDTYRERS
jgi:Flp pilus assembly protein TadG